MCSSFENNSTSKIYLCVFAEMIYYCSAENTNFIKLFSDILCDSPGNILNCFII